MLMNALSNHLRNIPFNGLNRGRAFRPNLDQASRDAFHVTPTQRNPL
jgi:hypothetical protein